MILVSLGDSAPVGVRSPNLLGAILVKARAVSRRRKGKFDSDRQDVIRLLSYVEDPRALARDEQLKPSERKWLRNIEGDLNFEDPALAALFPVATLERAKAAFELLSA